MSDVDPLNLERDGAILDGARRLIRERGLGSLTRSLLAQYAGVAPASVSNFGRTRLSSTPPPAEGYRERLLRALMAEAIAARDVVLIGAGLTDGCLQPDDLGDELRAVMGV